jgi:hypothetical protein
MKLTAWQMIAALAVLLTATIVVHVFAPTAVAAVGSMVGIAFAALFLNKHDDPPPPPATGEGPSLRVIPGGGGSGGGAARAVLSALGIGVAALSLAVASVLTLASCGGLNLESIDLLTNPKDDVALSECRAEGREAKQKNGGDAGAAYAEYRNCTRDAGLQK